MNRPEQAEWKSTPQGETIATAPKETFLKNRSLNRRLHCATEYTCRHNTCHHSRIFERGSDYMFQQAQKIGKKGQEKNYINIWKIKILADIVLLVLKIIMVARCKGKCIGKGQIYDMEKPFLSYSTGFDSAKYRPENAHRNVRSRYVVYMEV